MSKEDFSWNWSIWEVREDGFEGWIVRLSLIRGRSVRSLSIWIGEVGGIRVRSSCSSSFIVFMLIARSLDWLSSAIWFGSLTSASLDYVQWCC